MSVKEKIRECIKKVKGEYFFCENDLISSGFLSSFDLIDLIAKLEEVFQIEIPLYKIIPENLDSVDAIEELILQIEKN